MSEAPSWGSLQAEAACILGTEARIALKRTAALRRGAATGSLAAAPERRNPPPVPASPMVREPMKLKGSGLTGHCPLSPGSATPRTAGSGGRAAGLSSGKSSLPPNPVIALRTSKVGPPADRRPHALGSSTSAARPRLKGGAAKKHRGYYMAPSGYCFSRGSFYAFPTGVKIEETW